MLNKWTGIGRTGKDPEVKVFDGGNKVANISIACSETWKDKDGNKQEKTEWVNLAIFGNLADIVEKYVTKGMLLYVEGKLRTRSYDATDGTKRYVTEVVLQNYDGVLKMLGGKSDSSSTVQSEGQAGIPERQEGTHVEPIDTDELPF